MAFFSSFFFFFWGGGGYCFGVVGGGGDASANKQVKLKIIKNLENFRYVTTAI